MHGGRRRVAMFGLIVGSVGVAWLAPLMLDQLVLFADREQTAVAAASRSLMVWPSLLIFAAALLIGTAASVTTAVAAASPLAAVALAYAMPDALWQLVAFAISGPLAIGSMLAAVVPIRGQLAAQPVLVALLLAGLAAALTTLFLAVLAVIGLVAWWLLSWTVRSQPSASALD